MKTWAKAAVSGVVAALTAVATGLGDNVLTGQEMVTAAIAFFVALGVVYQVPNKP